MRAIELSAVGPIDNLRLVERPVPEPGPGQVRLRVDACGVCHRDLLDRRGAFPFMRTPIVPGHEVAGTVEALGPGVEGWAVGDRVLTLHREVCGRCEACRRGDTTHCSEGWAAFGLTLDGGYAESMIAPVGALVRCPEALAAFDAAPLICTWGTVWHGAFAVGGLQPGERVLVTGASGGVGAAMVQLAGALGCEVVAVTSREAKVPFLERLGAHHVIVSTDGRFNRDPRIAGGIDLSFEAVGGPTFAGSLRSLRAGGRLVLVGNVAQDAPPLPLGLVVVKGLSILGSDTCTASEAAAMMDFVVRRGLRVPIAGRLPLSAFADAQRRLEAGDVEGRLVLEPGR